MRTLQEQLREKGLSDARRQEKELQQNQVSKRPKETLTDKEWAEIMGTNHQTYRRGKGGAIRRNR